MKNFIKGVFLFIVMVIMSGCGSRAGESSDNLHKREPRTKKRIYAREVLVENLDYPMLLVHTILMTNHFMAKIRNIINFPTER